MSNTYIVTKEIKGKEYKAQFSGISTALKAVDSSYIDDSRNTSVEKIARYLFEHIVIEPRIHIEDFGADKIGMEETKIINGVEYTARFNGLSTALKALDGSYVEGTSNTSTEKLSQYLFDKVIVSPKNLTIDDFDNMDDFNEVVAFAREVMQGGEVMEEFNEVTTFAREVMQGNFREAKDTQSAKKASKG